MELIDILAITVIGGLGLYWTVFRKKEKAPVIIDNSGIPEYAKPSGLPAAEVNNVPKQDNEKTTIESADVVSEVAEKTTSGVLESKEEAPVTPTKKTRKPKITVAE